MKVALINNNQLGINGFTTFNEWSKLSKKYDEEKVLKIYYNIKPKDNGRLITGSFKKIAKEDNLNYIKN